MERRSVATARPRSNQHAASRKLFGRATGMSTTISEPARKRVDAMLVVDLRPAAARQGREMAASTVREIVRLLVPTEPETVQVMPVQELATVPEPETAPLHAVTAMAA